MKFHISQFQPFRTKQTFEPAFKNYNSTNIYDLNGKIQYIKMIKELEIDSYAEDVFEEIIGITYNLLQEK